MYHLPFKEVHQINHELKFQNQIVIATDKGFLLWTANPPVFQLVNSMKLCQSGECIVNMEVIKDKLFILIKRKNKEEELVSLNTLDIEEMQIDNFPLASHST